MKWKTLVVGIVVGAGCAFAFGMLHRDPPAPSDPAPMTITGGEIRLPEQPTAGLRFETAAVQLGPPLPRTPVTARVATLEARTAPSFAPLDGRIVEVSVRIGDKVKAGARLVLVRSGDLAGMKRDFKAAQLAVKTKQALVERLRLLVDSRAAPENDLLIAQSEANEAKLTAQATEAKLRSLNVGEEGENGYWVLATRSGTVVQLDAQAGKQVGPDKDKPVATVADLDEVLVLADVPERDAATLKAGMKVLITVPGAGEDPLIGKVDLVSDVVDAERQTVPVRIRASNPAHAMRANAYVEAAFVDQLASPVLEVPVGAVVTDGAISVVFVETQTGVFARRRVRVGHHTPEKVEIQEGLKPGEKVVVRGALLLLNAVVTHGAGEQDGPR